MECILCRRDANIVTYKKSKKIVICEKCYKKDNKEKARETVNYNK
jgi:hypothetical protein